MRNRDTDVKSIDGPRQLVRYNPVMVANSSKGVLDRLLDPVARCLTLESAKHLVSLRADPLAQDRIDHLAEASTEGRLSPEDRAEYEAYVAAASFIATLQSKARAMLSGKVGA